MQYILNFLKSVLLVVANNVTNHLLKSHASWEFVCKSSTYINIIMECKITVQLTVCHCNFE